MKFHQYEGAPDASFLQLLRSLHWPLLLQIRTKVGKPSLSHSGGFFQYRFEVDIAAERLGARVGRYAFLRNSARCQGQMILI